MSNDEIAANLTGQRKQFHGFLGHRQAWRDIKARGRGGSFWVLCLIVFFGFIKSLHILLTLPIDSPRLESACLPDGSFSLSASYNWWDPRAVFDITLGQGELTFTQAKAIDVVWDVGVGRGGQVLFAVISWRVFARYVTVSMATTPVTFQTFRTVFLHNEASVMSISRFIRDFSCRRGLRSKIAMVFMIMTMIFILAFPTLGSAMSGYKGNVESFVKSYDGNLLPFSSFNWPQYTIYDGDRVGKPKNFTMYYPKERETDELLPSYPNGKSCFGSEGWDTAKCELLFAITDYVNKYGLHGASNSSSKFMGTTLAAPVLNIEVFNLPISYLRKSRSYNAARFDIPWTLNWLAGDQTYSESHIKEKGSCQVTKTYQWGFSFIQLNIMIVLILLWMIGIFSMYIQSYLTMRRLGQTEVLGENQAVFELASAMQVQLNTKPTKVTAHDTTVVTERQLRRRIDKDLKGGAISLRPTLLDGDGYSSINEEINDPCTPFHLKDWLISEKWWLIGFFASVGFLWWALISIQHAVIFIVLPFAVLFAMYVSQSNRSRGVIIFWPLLILGVTPTVVLHLALYPPRRRYT